MEVEFHGLKFDLPLGWTDISNDLDEQAPPTLARPDGIGAIQFSIARYVGGENPNVTIEQLRTHLTEFARRNSLEFASRTEREGEMSFVTGRASAGDELFAVWFITNRLDVVLETYTSLASDDPRVASELNDAAHIAETMKF